MEPTMRLWRWLSLELSLSVGPCSPVFRRGIHELLRQIRVVAVEPPTVALEVVAVVGMVAVVAAVEEMVAEGVAAVVVAVEVGTSRP
jgi:hypothetical protein